MEYKRKRIYKSLVSLLLILTFVLAPFEGVFVCTLNSEASTYNTGGVKSNLGSSQPHPLKGLRMSARIATVKKCFTMPHTGHIINLLISFLKINASGIACICNRRRQQREKYISGIKRIYAVIFWTVFLFINRQYLVCTYYA